MCGVWLLLGLFFAMGLFSHPCVCALGVGATSVSASFACSCGSVEPLCVQRTS
mgnify:CR=1 FL=1